MGTSPGDRELAGVCKGAATGSNTEAVVAGCWP